MSRAYPVQMKKLLDILSQDGVLVNGKVDYSNTTKQAFWKHVANKLNRVENGVHKNTWQWCKEILFELQVWADWKSKVTKKANILLRKKSYNNLERYITTPLSNIELRLLRLVGYPLEESTEASKNGEQLVVNKTEAPDTNSEDMHVEFLDEISGEEYNGPYYVEPKDSNDVNIENIFNDKPFQHLDELLESDQSSDTETTKTRKVTKAKKKLISIEKYKVKATVALQKEKALQRREELRLKAIELKLKEEELRLKEKEMSKVNYLTNIEEEKLKCFRDINMSLKELLERSRADSERFHNPL
ncbi:uncharacterized protein LOC113225582 isoform X2 [Hyposmocoma kahamanoa]|uniref:uncharacterized protein LOC113225582 isoform X2 n=1 Tax=Hyposmocoma kahamanoa TaxID=1477025 RepID=UPI000E6D8F46|nr:uncharacterized protein LOC113225582 isoform X2 [Hyposmocoma kahamanoa]